MGRVPTVEIWHPEAGRIRINADRFDPDQHERYDGEAEVEVQEPVETEAGDDARYWIEENPPWLSIHGREEGKIGKSTRDEDEANARLKALIAENADG